MYLSRQTSFRYSVILIALSFVSWVESNNIIIWMLDSEIPDNLRTGRDIITFRQLIYFSDKLYCTYYFKAIAVSINVGEVICSRREYSSYVCKLVEAGALGLSHATRTDGANTILRQIQDKMLVCSLHGERLTQWGWVTHICVSKLDQH